MFAGPFDHSMLWKAKEKGLLEIELVDLREFGIGPRRQVDDTPYGGGAGMVLKPEPIFAAVEDAKKKSPKAKVLLMTPRGKKFDQINARKLAKEESLIIICGHYEGFDERIMELVNAEISIGDFVLTGGEIPAMAVVDAVVRLIPGVLGDEASSHDESFSRGVLEYPHFTRPDDFRGHKVPDVLKNGNHVKIEAWRRQEAVKKTQANRPDLLNF